MAMCHSILFCCNRIFVTISGGRDTKTSCSHTSMAQTLPNIFCFVSGILPTFGPAWLNFYGAARSFKFTDSNDELNEGIGEGAAYRYT